MWGLSLGAIEGVAAKWVWGCGTGGRGAGGWGRAEVSLRGREQAFPPTWEKQDTDCSHVTHVSTRPAQRGLGHLKVAALGLGGVDIDDYSILKKILKHGFLF